MKKIGDFISEINNLRAEMGRSTTLTQKEKLFVNEQKLNELNTKKEQIQEDIARQLDDFFAYCSMKQAYIDVLNDMLVYVNSEIKKLDIETKTFNSAV